MPLAAADPPVPKDVMIAVFGASAGVAGLVLVFLGVLITRLGTFPGGTSDEALRPYRQATWAAVAVFGASLLTTALALAWLALADARWLYALVLAAFGAVLAMLVALAAAVTRTTT